MTAPRQVLDNVTYLVTRRCSERRFFLRPSALVNQVFAYCLAYAAEQTGVLVHAVMVLSNHYHAVVTDPQGRLPEFMAHLNKLVSKCVNAELGRWESLWSPERYSAVRLGDAGAVLDKLVYCLANPVEAGLVRSSSQWPGLGSRPRDCTGPGQEVRRPVGFFRADGGMPEAVRLRMSVPPCFEELGGERYGTMLAKALEGRERELVEERGAEGRGYLGREGVLGQDPYGRPEGYEPRRGLDPRVAGRDKWRRVEALGRAKEFQEAYREAWKRFKGGERDVVFPAGTYWMCKHAGQRAVRPE